MFVIEEKEINLSIDELVLSFYICKWYVNGLNSSENRILGHINKEGKLSEFKESLKIFNSIISNNIESDLKVPKNVLKVYNELKNKTVTQNRRITLKILKKWKI